MDPTLKAGLGQQYCTGRFLGPVQEVIRYAGKTFSGGMTFSYQQGSQSPAPVTFFNYYPGQAILDAPLHALVERYYGIAPPFEPLEHDYTIEGRVYAPETLIKTVLENSPWTAISVLSIQVVTHVKNHLGQMREKLTQKTGMHWQINGHVFEGYQHINQRADFILIRTSFLALLPPSLRNKATVNIFHGNLQPWYIEKQLTKFWVVSVRNLSDNEKRDLQKTLTEQTLFTWQIRPSVSAFDTAQENVLALECWQCLTPELNQKAFLQSIPSTLSQHITHDVRCGKLAPVSFYHGDPTYLTYCRITISVDDINACHDVQ